MSTARFFGLSGRVQAVVAVSLLALASTAGFSWLKLSGMSGAAGRTAEIRVPQLDRVAAIELNLTRVSMQVRHAMLSRTSEELAATLADQDRSTTTGSSTAARMVKYQRDLLALGVTAMVGLALFGWRFMALLNGRIAASRILADRVRDGDLTHAVVDTARDEFSPMLRALRQMQHSLANVVGAVRLSADGVATASTEFSSGNQDLSRRTERQARPLQQTATSMEQLGGTVRQNADNASRANQLALGTSRAAQCRRGPRDPVADPGQCRAEPGRHPGRPGRDADGPRHAAERGAGGRLGLRRPKPAAAGASTGAGGVGIQAGPGLKRARRLRRRGVAAPRRPPAPAPRAPACPGSARAAW